MTPNRRETLKLGAVALLGLGTTVILPWHPARAQDGGDRFETAKGGEIKVFPVAHASFVMTVPGMTIYADPVGGAAAFEGHPAPDLILVTHEHGDHFDLPTLEAIAGANTRLVTNPSVFEKLPEGLKSRAAAIGNGETTTVGDVSIAAIPAYNTTPDRLKYHPKGRDNGYVLTIDGSRVYVAGDTEDIPEMRALTDILVAFLPMNLPYTMDIDQASSAVAEFKPAFVYPYHYGESDPLAFATKVTEAAPDTRVMQGKWYG